MTKRSLDKISSSDKGVAGGVCPLDSSGYVPDKHLRSASTSTAAYATLNANGKLSLDVVPQGTGSGLDADTVDGVHAASLARVETEIVCQYPLQGGGQLSGDVTIGLATDVLNERFDHEKLLNIGTNSHEDIDSFIALATASPTAGAIPLADGSGTLNNWVNIPAFDDFWEIDIDGHLVPSQNPTTSTLWELDGDGHIVPKAV